MGGQDDAPPRGRPSVRKEASRRSGSRLPRLGWAFGCPAVVQPLPTPQVLVAAEVASGIPVDSTLRWGISVPRPGPRAVWIHPRCARRSVPNSLSRRGRRRAFTKGPGVECEWPCPCSREHAGREAALFDRQALTNGRSSQSITDRRRRRAEGPGHRLRRVPGGEERWDGGASRASTVRRSDEPTPGPGERSAATVMR